MFVHMLILIFLTGAISSLIVFTRPSKKTEALNYLLLLIFIVVTVLDYPKLVIIGTSYKDYALYEIGQLLLFLLIAAALLVPVYRQEKCLSRLFVVFSLFVIFITIFSPVKVMNNYATVVPDYQIIITQNNTPTTYYPEYHVFSAPMDESTTITVTQSNNGFGYYLYGSSSVVCLEHKCFLVTAPSGTIINDDITYTIVNG